MISKSSSELFQWPDPPLSETGIAWSSEIRSKASRVNSLRDPVSGATAPSTVSSTPVLGLHLAGRDHIKLDIRSQSDPMCIMVNGGWVEFSRTEVTWNNPNPTYAHMK
jgi:hypothetical protein